MKEYLTFDDVLLEPQYSDIGSRADVCIGVVAKKDVYGLSLPIFSSNMDTITESKMANYIRSKGGAGVIHRFMSIEDNVKQYLESRNNTFVSIGTSDGELERFHKLYEAGSRYFCVDVAHGYSKKVAETIYAMKVVVRGINKIVVMAGNVATYEGAKFLEDAGADLIKVGIGPGSVCSTRIKTGHGIPQLSAIMECSKVGVSVVADGGIRTPGDIVKALAAGADFVMLGSMLAGTNYTPGEVIYTENPGPNGPVKHYRGMASKEVADDKLGGLTEWKTAEGVSVTVPYKNEVETDAIISDIIGGIRSGLTYSGAKSIRELQKKAKFVRITNAGLTESFPHRK